MDRTVELLSYVCCRKRTQAERMVERSAEGNIM